MDQRHLDTFAQIIATGSQAGAALALGHAPSTVTLHLHELERELGGPLFRRRGRHRELTPIGLELLRHARVVSESLASLRASTRPVVDEGPLELGSVEPVAHQRVVPLLAQLIRRAPDTRLTLTVGGTGVLSELVANGALDLAITTTPRRAGLEFVPWYDEALAIALPSTHPLARQRTVTVDEVLGHPLLVSEPTCAYRAAVARAFRRAHVHPRVRAELGSQRALVAAARAGLGLAIGPLRGFASDDELTVRPLSGVQVTIGLITARKRALSGLLDEVRTRLLASPA